MGITVNKRDLSELIGVSERSLTEWQKEGLPVIYRGIKGEPNQYDTEKVIAWMIDHRVGKVRDESPKDRLTRLQGDKVELEIADKLSNLVPVSEIKPSWDAMVSSAKAFLDQQPDRLAQLMAATEGMDAKRYLLADEFDQILNQLAQYEPAE